MAEVKTHTFNGRVYGIEAGPLDGWCDQYVPEHMIVINRDLDTRGGLETAIHEALHACNWKATEENVTMTAYDIARFLWRLGYRKVNNGKIIKSKSSPPTDSNGG